MKLSAYIGALEALFQEHGDLDVMRDDSMIGARRAPAPILGYIKVLKGRESKPRLCGSYDVEDLRGAPVIKV